MAIELGRLSSTVLGTDRGKNNNLLGLDYPFNGSGNSVFRANFTTLDQKVANLINVITTQKTERMINVEFGSTILSKLFENRSELFIDSLRDEIINTAALYVPELEIGQVRVGDNTDDNSVNLQIQVKLKTVSAALREEIAVVDLFIDDKGNIFTRTTSGDLKFVQNNG